MNEENISGKADVYCKYTKEGSKDYINVTANILGVNEEIFRKFEIGEKDITPQYLTKVLNEYSKTILLDNQINFATSRTSSSRLVTLEKDIEETSKNCYKNDISIYDNVINDNDDAKNI